MKNLLILLYGETVIQDDMDLSDLVKGVFPGHGGGDGVLVLTLVTVPYVRGFEQQLLSYSRRGHVAKVQEVYEALGFPQDPDVTDQLGRTPLYMAASRGHWEIVRLLCDKSASLDKTCTQLQRTALCVAAKRGHSKVIQILCEAGANKDWPDIWGASPLLYACRTGHFEAARLLCKARANVDQADLEGQTPLSLCDVEQRRLWVDGFDGANCVDQTKISGGQMDPEMDPAQANPEINLPQGRVDTVTDTGHKKRWLRCRRYALRTALGAFQFSLAARRHANCSKRC